MTKREAAIITAYTGVFIGDLDELYKYAKELLGCPVFSHEFLTLADEIKEKSKKDFLALKVE